MAQTVQDGERGCILGGAVGDALGASTEGRSSEEIKARFGGWVTDFAGPFNPDWHKNPRKPLRRGEGQITDDTLMVLALTNVYEHIKYHLTAHDLAEHLVPEITDKVVYIPELERETVLVTRLAGAETYLALRLKGAHADPREAGVGNVVNCGAAMYMAPVGIVNAGDPAGAYREAVDVAGAHQQSYGREAAGVMAAAVAEALRPDATVQSVVEVCTELSRDRRHDAIMAVTQAAQHCSGWEEASLVLREAVRPFDSVGDSYRQPSLNARTPSRCHAIEELPVAMGMLVATRGDYLGTTLGRVNYGRDSDSIAAVGGAIAGALHGAQAVPKAWARVVSEISRRTFEETADTLARVAQHVFEHKSQRWHRRVAGFPNRA